MNDTDSKKDNLTKWLKCTYYALGIAKHLGLAPDKVIKWLVDAIKNCFPHDL